MPFQRDMFIALVASGAIWTVGASGGLGTPALGVIAAAYVLVGSLALALSRGRALAVLIALWGCAVVLMTMITVAVAGFMTIAAGLILGTLCFAAWTSMGFLLLHAFRRRTGHI